MTDKFMTNKEILVFEDDIEDIIKDLRNLSKNNFPNIRFHLYLKKEKEIDKYNIIYTSERNDLEPNGYIYISKVRDLVSDSKYVRAWDKACKELGYDPDSDEAEESDETYNLTKELEKDLIIEDLIKKIKECLKKLYVNKIIRISLNDNDIFEFKF